MLIETDPINIKSLALEAPSQVQNPLVDNYLWDMCLEDFRSSLDVGAIGTWDLEQAFYLRVFKPENPLLQDYIDQIKKRLIYVEEVYLRHTKYDETETYKIWRRV